MDSTKDARWQFIMTLFWHRKSIDLRTAIEEGGSKAQALDQLIVHEGSLTAEEVGNPILI